MTDEYYSDSYIEGLLASVKSVAIVGASPKNVRPSYFVVKYLISKGYDVYPINPGHAGRDICGAKTYGALSDVPGPIDMVDIFRSSEAALQITRDALELDPLPKIIWMQLTIRNEEAAKLAREKNIEVVMNRCPKIEYARLSGEIGWAGVASRKISARKPKLAKGFQRFGLT